MSKIALAYGGTIDKFVGDAMLIFFGDPETKGDAEDDAGVAPFGIEPFDPILHFDRHPQARLGEFPFRVRMGINTGFCNVGNFGSDDVRVEIKIEPGQMLVEYRNGLALNADNAVDRIGNDSRLIPFMVIGWSACATTTSRTSAYVS
jgi:hypothetical protein